MYRVRDYVRKEQMRQIAQQLDDCQEEEKYDSCSRTHKISQASCPLSISLFNDSTYHKHVEVRSAWVVITVRSTMCTPVFSATHMRSREF